MLKYMPEYETVFDKELNVELMEKQDDKPLLDFILESWYSLEIIEGIKILDWKYTDKESEIDVNRYIFKRNRNVKQKERFEWKYIDESRLGLLTVRVQLTVNTIDPKTNEEVTKQQIITKSMLIPIQDEDGCYCLSGQQVYMIFQLVEKSTYTAANSVILKSLMPFATRRYQINVRDINDVEYTLPYYTIELFKKDVEVMLIYATKGLNSAIQFALEAPYLVLNFVDEVTDKDKEDLNVLIFQISSKLYLKVNKQLFDQFVYVRSVVGGILRISTNRLTLDKIDDKELWLKKLGGSNIEKGKNLLRSAKRLLDQTTGRILRLDIYQKHDVYSLIRWMMQEYNDLRMKDNMNLRNKRLRSNEIPSCLMTQEFSIRLNRLMSYGKKADLDNYREVFSFSGDLIKITRMSPLNLSNCGDVSLIA